MTVKKRSEAAQNENSCVEPIDSDPGDDTMGVRVCERRAAAFLLPPLNLTFLSSLSRDFMTFLIIVH